MNSQPGAPERKTAFVISPIGTQGSDTFSRFKLSLEYVIKKALPATKWDVIRADLESSPDSITGKVISRIVESDLIVADLSNHNPNVFYELAVAHGYKRPVVHIMEEGQRVPFDVGDQRVIFYDLTNPASVDKAVNDLARAAEHLDVEGSRAKNPLTEFEMFAKIRSGEGADDAGTAVANALADLSLQVRRLGRRMDLQERRDRRVGDSSVHVIGKSLRHTQEEFTKVRVALDELEKDPWADTEEVERLKARRDELRARLEGAIDSNLAIG